MEIPAAFEAPPLAYRFHVLFMTGRDGVNPIDVLFNKVSGIESTVATRSIDEGGQNLYSHRLPHRLQSGTLTLERGLVIGSPLGIEFNAAMSRFQFSPASVLVSLLNEVRMPTAAWLFLKAWPLKWRLSDLDADANRVAIETFELAYTHMQTIRV